MSLSPRDREIIAESPIRLARLVAAQDNICAGCGKPMLKVYGSKQDDRPTIDHAIPRARGGRDVMGNIIAMHLACNNVKADDMPTGCELIWLLAVNCRLGVEPQRW